MSFVWAEMIGKDSEEEASSVSRGLEWEDIEHVLVFGAQGWGQSSDLMAQKSVGSIQLGVSYRLELRLLLGLQALSGQGSSWGGGTLWALSLPLGFSHYAVPSGYHFSFPGLALTQHGPVLW